MSYRGGHGGRRKPYRDSDSYGGNDRSQVHESPEDKLKKNIIGIGEVDPTQEITRLAKQIREFTPLNVPIVSESFRIGVTEQPFKIPYYAALLRVLHDAGDEADAETNTIGKQVLEDYWKGFQAFLDKLEWREIRLSIQFFAHLTVANIISTQSFSELLKSFTAVLDEFAVTHGRATKAALCACEGLMIAGPVIKRYRAEVVSEVISSIQSYIESSSTSKILVRPVALFFSEDPNVDCADELLDSALAALKILDSSDFAETTDSWPQPYTAFSVFDAPSFELPSILVPPEVIELDGLSTDSGEDVHIQKEDWPQFRLRLFDDAVTPNPNTPSGYALRSGLHDLIDIFEVNRKECARLLLEFPKWTLPGTFKPRPGAPAQEPVEGKGWELENTVIETILGALFLLPEPVHKSIYYISLIIEIAKLSPSTVGPAVGKSIRRLYALLADGLDVEISHRMADWFSVHMSNFNFGWVWKEWIPDLALTPRHPKRVFMRRVVEFEIRLSYYDRILKTLPEPMQDVGALVMPEEAPGPDFEYEDPEKPHHDAAQTVLEMLRGRAKADDVIAHLQTLKSSLSETPGVDGNADTVVRYIAVQSLLHIGSRSFSHFLNAIERYLPLLRNLATGNEARMDILSAVAAFWKRSKHMVVIVFDKLMQYQIVDPTDVVAWTFTHGSFSSKSTFNSFQWDLLKGALDKANGRVVVARKKVAALRKEEDDNAARALAGDASMEVDAEARQDVIQSTTESAALTTARKAFSTLTREQKGALSRALDGFVDYLVGESTANPKSREVITEAAWQSRATWGEDEWNVWESWGWYRHWSRMFSPYLRIYVNTLEAGSLSKIGPSSDHAADVFRKTWNVAIGQEV